MSIPIQMWQTLPCADVIKSLAVNGHTHYLFMQNQHLKIKSLFAGSYFLPPLSRPEEWAHCHFGRSQALASPSSWSFCPPRPVGSDESRLALALAFETWLVLLITLGVAFSHLVGVEGWGDRTPQHACLVLHSDMSLGSDNFLFGGVYKPTKLAYFGPTFCPKVPQMTTWRDLEW